MMKSATKIDQITRKIKDSVCHCAADDLIYELLRAYGKPESTIHRLRSGAYNQSQQDNTMLWKKHVFYQVVDTANLTEAFHQACQDFLQEKQPPRFIIMTDGKVLLAKDTRTDEKINTYIKKIANHVAFFLPWAGLEKSECKNIFDIDISATKKIAALYDEIKKTNAHQDEQSSHSLNVLFVRLLYCFFAEDTDLFAEAQFSNAIASYTEATGEDVGEILRALFEVLNTEDGDAKRRKLPNHLKQFPYVNGGAFAEEITMPKFTKRARKLLLECGEINWREVTPDIFGSMVQTIILPELRKELGVHYTSPENIHKVIDPLFVEELKENLADAEKEDSSDALLALMDRICKIKVFDPACGSGNFLIISYNVLRDIDEQARAALKMRSDIDVAQLPNMSLTQFYGIEINDFMQHVAIISLCMAEHLKNTEYRADRAKTLSLPLADLRQNIICANAARVEWNSVCYNDGSSEIYVVSNPPYAGSRQRSKEQREDMDIALNSINNYKSLDYVAIWFYLASLYLRDGQEKVALVSTNSICQGQQAPILWPVVFKMGTEIGFAYPEFKWSNLAAAKAGVTCSIVELQPKISGRQKKLYINGKYRVVKNINEYLLSGESVYLEKSMKSISNFPECIFGNKLTDNGYLIFSADEKINLIRKNKKLSQYFRRILSGSDLIYDNHRYCLFLRNADENTLSNSFVKERLDLVSEFRKKSPKKSTRDLSKKPNEFQTNRLPKSRYLAIPITSSERRDYIPCDFVSPDVIALSGIQMIPGADAFTFGIVSSKLMMLWTKIVSGKLETSIRFSSELCYNTFPFPSISEEKKQQISEAAENVLLTRAKHPAKNLAQLYDPDTMPDDLREAHRALDHAIESCYQDKPFESDAERLECLFNLYHKMVYGQRAQDAIAAANDNIKEHNYDVD